MCRAIVPLVLAFATAAFAVIDFPENVKIVTVTLQAGNAGAYEILINGYDIATALINDMKAEKPFPRSAGKHALITCNNGNLMANQTVQQLINSSTIAFIISEELFVQKFSKEVLDKVVSSPALSCTYSYAKKLPIATPAVIERNVYLLPLGENPAPHQRYPVVNFQSGTWYYVVQNQDNTKNWSIKGDDLWFKEPNNKLIYKALGPFIAAKILNQS